MEKISKEAAKFTKIVNNSLINYVHENGVQKISKILVGGCGIGSFILYKKLKKRFPRSNVHFIKGTFWDLGTHCWVEMNGIIYDPTSCQFDFPMISFPQSIYYKKYKKDVQDNQAIAEINRYWTVNPINSFSFSWEKENLIVKDI